MWEHEKTLAAWVPCEQPSYSFYHDFIKIYWEGGPSDVDGATVHRLCTLARKMGARSFVVEDSLSHYRSGRKEIESEIKHLYEVSNDPEYGYGTVEGAYRAATITFLSSRPRPDGKTGAIPEHQVIGQMTIITFPLPEPDQDLDQMVEGDGAIACPLEEEAAAGSPCHRRSYIYEAIFRLPAMGKRKKPLLNNYVPVSKSIPVQIRDHKVEVRASYFCQQNGVTSICGHCAVRTLIRTKTNEKVRTAELNTLWPDFLRKRQVDVRNVAQALREIGKLNIQNYSLERYRSDVPRHTANGAADGGHEETDWSVPADGSYTPDSIWNMLALMVDSGAASLLILASSQSAVDHVVPILGHTFNSDEWHPLGKELLEPGQKSAASSNLWVDHLVMHDDIAGPYYCLSRAGLFPVETSPRATRDQVRAALPKDAIFSDGEIDQLMAKIIPAERSNRLIPKQVLSVMPDDIMVSPVMAEKIARKALMPILREVDDWEGATGRWWTFFRKNHERRIFRTTLIDRRTYLQSLTRDPNSNEQRMLREEIERLLPPEFWLAEITLSNLLLANRAKLGELLIDPFHFYANEADPDLDPDPGEEFLPMRSIYGFRLPSVLGLNTGTERGFAMWSWPEQGHQPILANHHNHRW